MYKPKMLVCGGRDFTDKLLLFSRLDEVCLARNWIIADDPEAPESNWLASVTLIHGGAKGADLLADAWAVNNWCSIIQMKADWKTHGKAAGPLRNHLMLKEKPDLVIAFPGGKGTAHMVKIAKQEGIEVMEIVDETI